MNSPLKRPRRVDRPTASRVEVIAGGDLLRANERFICHQGNCISKGARGLALAIYKKYPAANVYKRRHGNSVPGTIDVARVRDGFTVVALFAQFHPGKPNNSNDSREHRLHWFRQALDSFAKECLATLNGGSRAVGMPYNIGSALAGGHWPDYLEAIESWAGANEVTVRLYDLDGNSQTNKQRNQGGASKGRQSPWSTGSSGGYGGVGGRGGGRKSGDVTFLAVAFEERDEVKCLGGRWDAVVKKWYVPAGKDTSPFSRWWLPTLTQPSPPLSSSSSPASFSRQKWVEGRTLCDSGGRRGSGGGGGVGSYEGTTPGSYEGTPASLDNSTCVSTDASKEQAVASSSWACGACTFDNKALRISCSICGTPRSK